MNGILIFIPGLAIRTNFPNLSIDLKVCCLTVKIVLKIRKTIIPSRISKASMIKSFNINGRIFELYNKILIFFKI